MSPCVVCVSCACRVRVSSAVGGGQQQVTAHGPPSDFHAVCASTMNAARRSALDIVERSKIACVAVSVCLICLRFCARVSVRCGCMRPHVCACVCFVHAVAGCAASCACSVARTSHRCAAMDEALYIVGFCLLFGLAWLGLVWFSCELQTCFWFCCRCCYRWWRWWWWWCLLWLWSSAPLGAPGHSHTNTCDERKAVRRQRAGAQPSSCRGSERCRFYLLFSFDAR